jgi:Lysozyme like domain
MTKALTKRQIEEEWVKAGGAAAKAPLMAAIALAESGGNPSSVNPEGPEHAEGLWQIKGQIVKGNPLNPGVSAANAVAKLRSQGLGAWTTYTSGAYKPFLTSAGSSGPHNAQFLGIPLVPNPAGPLGEIPEHAIEGKSVNPIAPLEGAVGTVEGAVGAVKTTAQVMEVIGEWISDPMRIVKAVGGGILLGVGLKTLTRGSTAGAVSAAVQPVKGAHRGTMKLVKKAAEVAAA